MVFSVKSCDNKFNSIQQPEDQQLTLQLQNVKGKENAEQMYV